MAEKDRTPEIRFVGFTDAWEECKLGSTFEDHIEKTTIQNQYSVLTSSQQKGIVLQEDYFANRKVTTANIGYYVLPRGYFTFRSRSDNNIFVFNRNDVIDKGIISYFYPVFHVRDVDSNFLLRRLNYGIQRQVTIASVGTGQHVLSLNKFKEITAAFPTIDEQRKIGTLFEQLDNLIALHQRKYDKLVIVKKFMLEKMFPKDGANVPEIRLAGFTEAWEQRKLGDVTFPLGVKNSDNIPYESYSISNKNGFIPQNEQFENGGTMRDADKSMYYIVSPQSFAYNPARINVGSIGYQNLSKSVIVSSLYEVFKTTDECDDGFLWYWIKTDYFQKLIERYQAGGVRLYFYYDKFCKGTLPLPNVDEQHKIGVFFTHLDNLNTLHQHELEKLKNIKKSILEKMFV